MELNALEIGLLIALIYICVISIINRICKCIEHCATTKSFNHFINDKEAIKEAMRHAKSMETISKKETK